MEADLLNAIVLVVPQRLRMVRQLALWFRDHLPDAGADTPQRAQPRVMAGREVTLGSWANAAPINRE